MRTFQQHFKDFLKRKDGPTTFKYAVMQSMIITVSVGAVTILGSKTTQPLPTVSNAVKVGSS